MFPVLLRPVTAFELMRALVDSGWAPVVRVIRLVKSNRTLMLVLGVLNYVLPRRAISGRRSPELCYVLLSLLGAMKIGDSVECGPDRRKLKFPVSLLGTRPCRSMLPMRLISRTRLVVVLGAIVTGMLLAIMIILVLRLTLQLLEIIGTLLCGLRKLVLAVRHTSGLAQKSPGILVFWVWCMCLMRGRQVSLLMNLQVCGNGVVRLVGLSVKVLPV